MTQNAMTGLAGMSVGKKLFEERSTLEYYVQYLHNNFDRGIILLSDVPKRHNIMLFEGVSEDEALRKARTNAANIRQTLKPLVVNTNIEVRTWDDCGSPQYYNNLEVLKKTYETNGAFRIDVQNQTREFLEGSNRAINDWDAAVDKAKEYVLEEVAMLSAMSYLHRPMTEVYPGKLLLQEKIVRHEHSFDGLFFEPSWHIRERYPEKGFKVGPKLNIGYTLYATREYEKGEYIFTIAGPIRERPSNYTVPIADNLFIDPANEGKYLCHSCKPTAGIKDRDKVFAIRNINPGQEIAIDYAMIVRAYNQDVLQQDLICRCKTKECRGELGSWESLPEALKEIYRPFTSAYLLEDKP